MLEKLYNNLFSTLDLWSTQTETKTRPHICRFHSLAQTTVICTRFERFLRNSCGNDWNSLVNATKSSTIESKE